MSESSAASPIHPPAPEPIPELLELGQRLRRAREGRGIGVAELADRLHLAQEQLTALESGDRLHLHEPVFVIAQAKRVAQALGVDVTQQVEHLRQSRLMERPAPAQATDLSRAGGDAGLEPGERPRAHWGLAAAVAALTVLLAVLLAQALRQWPTPRLGDSLRPAPQPAPGPGRKAAATVSPGVLVLRSEEPSWVEVRTASRQILFSGMLEKEARFRLGPGLRVLAGRPDLVTASVGSAPPRRLGTISQVDWQDFPSSPAPAVVPGTAPAPAPAP